MIRKGLFQGNWRRFFLVLLLSITIQAGFAGVSQAEPFSPVFVDGFNDWHGWSFVYNGGTTWGGAAGEWEVNINGTMATGYYPDILVGQYMVSGSITDLASVQLAEKAAWLADNFAVGLGRDWHPEGYSGYSASEARAAMAFALFEIFGETAGNPYDLSSGNFYINVGPANPLTLAQAYLNAVSAAAPDTDSLETKFDIIAADQTNENWMGLGYANFLVYNPPCNAPPSGMVSWWDGENDALDIIGSNHGTLQGGATFAAGKVGQAFSFDGVNDYVQVPDSASLDVTRISTSFWFKLNELNRIHELLNKIGFNTISYGSEIGENNKAYFRISTDGTLGSLVDAASTTVFTSGIWYHFAGTYDGSSVKIYINGIEEDSQSQSGDIFNSPENLKLGTYGYFPWYLNGLLDEVVVFNRALSSEEIAAIYNAGSSGTCAPDTTPDPFTFDPVTGASLSTPYTSDTITVSGINLPVGITVTGGEYSIGCTESFTAAEGTVANDETVCVRQTSSFSYSTTTTTTLTIGEGSADFDVTTLASHTVQVSPSGTVSAGASVGITSSTGGIDCNWNGSSSSGTCISGAIGDGSEVVLTADLPAGTTVAWVAGCDSSTASTCTINSLTSNITISPVTTAQTFTITVTGTGVNGGTMTEGSSISATWDGSLTGGTDSEQVIYGAGPVSVVATAYTGIYATWSGDCDSTDGNGTAKATCTIDTGIIADKNIASAFSEYEVRRFASGVTGYHNTLQDAYDNADEGETIQARAVSFAGDLNLSLPKSVTIKCGFNSGFADNPTFTSLQGSLIIGDGTLIIENLIIQ